MIDAPGNAGPPPLIEVGCAVIVKERKLLVAQRKDGDSHGGLWEFPGGKKECDETIERCLEREVREELGIEIRALKLIARHDCVYAERTIALLFYDCEWVSGEPQCLDCQAVKWATAADLPHLSFPPGDEDVLKILLRSGRLQ